MHTIRLLTIVSVLTLAGCQSRGPAQPQAKNKDGGHGSDAAADAYDDAIETIATNDNQQAVQSADKTLRNGGSTAIASLRRHLIDRRIPPSNYLTRAVTGTPDMGDHCFWLIQDMIEPPVSKSNQYSKLNRSNISEWLDDRAGKTLLELQIDAASESLELAKTDLKQNGTPRAKNAIETFTKRIQTLKAQSAQ